MDYNRVRPHSAHGGLTPEAGRLRNLISEKEGGAQWYCAFDPERVAILLVGGDKSSARLMISY